MRSFTVFVLLWPVQKKLNLFSSYCPKRKLDPLCPLWDIVSFTDCYAYREDVKGPGLEGFEQLEGAGARADLVPRGRNGRKGGSSREKISGEGSHKCGLIILPPSGCAPFWL